MATTLTGSGELTYLSFPIEKTETTAEGDLLVYGKATDGSVDSDGQIVDMGWSAKALQEWLESAGNVRVQHQAQRDPAGKGLEVEYGTDGHYVKSLIVEPVAKRLVEKGVLTAYSVGISRPVIEPDVTGRARGGVIKGGQLVELSLVDRPANKNCGIQLVKSADGGGAEWVGKVWGDELLTKDQGSTTTPLTATADPEDAPEYEGKPEPGTEPTDVTEPTGATKSASVSLELPEDITVGFSPADLAKVIAHRNGGSDGGNEVEAVAEADLEKKKLRAAERKKIPTGQFAYVSPDGERKLPIHDESHVRNALSRFNQTHFHSPEAKASAGRKIRAAARRMGIDVSEGSNVAEATSKAADAESREEGGAFEGAAPPFDGRKPKKKKAGGNKSLAGASAEDLLAALAALGKTSTVRCDVCKDTGMVDGQKCMKCMGMGKAADADPDAAAKAIARMDRDDHDVDSDSDEDDKGTDKAQRNWPTPADGVTGMHAEPVPMHKEPDGSDIEEFEEDARMTDGDREAPSRLEQQIKGNPADERDAALMFKSLGVPQQLGILHDLCCPAYEPAVVGKMYPDAELSGLDIQFFADKAMDMAASATLEEAAKAAKLWTHARTLKSVDEIMIAELRAEAHKAFRDANPGPGSAPTPGTISPQKYKRPYISGGHAAESAAPHAGQPKGSIPSGQITADQYTRGFLTEGHESDSPGNKSATGVPMRVDYVPTIRENARQAMTAMHDHIAQTFPDVCGMELSGDAHEITSRPVPVPAGTPAPSGMHVVGQAHKGAVEPDVEKAQKKLRRKLGKRVLAGRMTVDEARGKLGRAMAQKAGGQTALGVTGAGAMAGSGMKSESEPAATAVADAAAPAAPDVSKAAGIVQPDLVKSAVAEALAPVLAQLLKSETALAEQADALEKQRELLKKQSKMLDAIAGSPDTSIEPFRGLAGRPPMNTSQRPAGAATVAEIAERTQAMMLRELETQFRTSPDPAQREAAWQSIKKMRGLSQSL